MPASLTAKKPAGFGAFGAFGGKGASGGLPKPSSGMGGLPAPRRAAAPPPGASVRAKPRMNKLAAETKPNEAPGGGANWDQVNKDTSETVTFDATHRHWIGQVLLHKDHRFDKEGRGGGGGTWTVEWSGNAERGVRRPCPAAPATRPCPSFHARAMFTRRPCARADGCCE